MRENSRLLLIDLDDTLYDERSYVLSGFRAVAEHLAITENIDDEHCFALMVDGLVAEGRGRIFDRVLTRLDIGLSPQRIESLVEVYRDHRPKIAFYPGVADTLARLATAYDVAVVTDGLGQMQRRKIEALELSRFADPIICCWDYDAPKPSVGGYLAAMKQHRREANRCIVIGDNPAHDIAAANALGIRSIRVRTGRFAALSRGTDPKPSADIACFAAVEAALGKI